MIRATQAQTVYFILTKTYLASEKAASPVEAVRRLVALPASTSTQPFLALRARLDAWQPADLLSALYQKRTLIKRPAMRNEPHLVSVEDYAFLQSATQRQRRQHFNSEFINWEIDLAEVEVLAEAIMTAAGQEPATQAEIEARLRPDLVRQLTQTSRGGRVSTISNVALVLDWLEANGRLAVSQPTPPADWRTETPSYAPLATWAPHLDLNPDLSEAEAQRWLVRAYLATFGPATEADISFWTGFGKSETQRAVSALARETTLTMVDGIPGAMLLLKEQAERLKATPVPVDPVVNLLPADDPFIKAYKASRARFFTDPRLQRQVFSSTDQAKPTIVVGGKIVGTWRWERNAGQARLIWHLLAAAGPDLDTRVDTQIQTELAQLAAFAGPEVVLEREGD